ncbi:hypothetical protein TVAG_329170 [Trichomonas vaginalis G3]|uniref:Uncharacterized protein n=1 Tax=Trichomonas vaginalis (strain ATCC PRA-98 / G3) TaxID=412133 RepID=A2EB85_TRIV3|nr:hypothetical protein TVAGG3_0309900 [Trichomonas vaginalis G3]EAY10030.1 hypothetical protein TVAG_329170 [Trichomonas vaginalis G3]KAI5528519.1 hypothetical protein TVAGG3_0309900 [Trichomonas vaginalis G3]|eukprot:XP_001322253.1 hypothetical protein [Trichomonas vaginalis G3]
MGCCNSAEEQALAPQNLTSTVTVSNIPNEQIYENKFAPQAEGHDKVPLLNAVSTQNITFSDDTDSSSVDQDMIKNLLDQVKLSDDDDY